MKTFYNLIPGAAGAPSRLYIDGEITGGEDSYDWWTGAECKGAQSFRHELDALGDVDVYINSPGGDVFAGATMYSLLAAHPGRVRVYIMGIAASAASVVAMAGDEVYISPVGYLMIHDPWSVIAGNARQLEKEAQVLREIGEGVLSAYEKKTGLSRDELREMLAAETYMNAQAAIEKGFCDGLWEDAAEAPAAKATNPAAVMRGQSYAPAAYMARLRAPVPENEQPDPVRQAVSGALDTVKEALRSLRGA